jgi:uncharacterized membrane protein YhaH (DUF805 family)
MTGTLLQFGGFYGGGLGEILLQLERADFFSVVLPFILIFALVFAILSKVSLFREGDELKNKAPVVLISLAIGLLSLQLGFVSRFFQDIFPKFGIGLSVLLIGLILLGTFLGSGTQSARRFNNLFLTLGAIIFVIVVGSSLDWIGTAGFGYGAFNYFFQRNLGYLIGLALFVLAAVWIIKSGSNSEQPAPQQNP